MTRTRYLLLVAAAVPVGLLAGCFLSTHFAATSAPATVHSATSSAAARVAATPASASVSADRGTLAESAAPAAPPSPTPSPPPPPPGIAPVRTDLALSPERGGAYVRAVYADAVGHDPDKGTLDRWSAKMGDGASRLDFASAVTGGADWRARAVDDLYRRLLDRAPTAPEAQNALAMAGDGAALDAAEASIVASDDYFQRAGSTDDGWVRALYRDLFGRPPDSGGLLSLLGVLHYGGGRGAVAASLVGSPERRAHAVDRLFARYLGRSPQPGEVTWFTAATPWQSEAYVAAQLIASDEYVRQHGGA